MSMFSQAKACSRQAHTKTVFDHALRLLLCLLSSLLTQHAFAMPQEDPQALPQVSPELLAESDSSAQPSTPSEQSSLLPKEKQANAALDSMRPKPELSPEQLAELEAALAQDRQKLDELDQPSSPNKSNPIMAAIQSMNPDMALILNVAYAWFSDDKPLQSGAHDPRQRGLNFQQLEMSLSASIDHYFRFDSNMVFSLAGVEIEEAYITTLSLPWSLQARAGQFLTRMGRINATHPHSWDFIDQPLVLGKFYGGEGNRGLGLELSWLSPLPWYLELVLSANMPTGSGTNRSFLGKSEAIFGEHELLYTIAAKQFFALSEELGLFWGLNAQFGPNDSGNGNRTDIYSTDIYLKYKPQFLKEGFFALQAEAFFRLRQQPKALLFDSAGYAHLVWQIDSEWSAGLRGEWGTGVKGDLLNPEWTKERGRFAVTAAWSGTHFSKLRAQFSVDFPRWRDPIYAFMLGLEVVAGTHPAHAY